MDGLGSSCGSRGFAAGDDGSTEFGVGQGWAHDDQPIGRGCAAVGCAGVFAIEAGAGCAGILWAGAGPVEVAAGAGAACGGFSGTLYRSGVGRPDWGVATEAL